MGLIELKVLNCKYSSFWGFRKSVKCHALLLGCLDAHVLRSCWKKEPSPVRLSTRLTCWREHWLVNYRSAFTSGFRPGTVPGWSGFQSSLCAGRTELAATRVYRRGRPGGGREGKECWHNASPHAGLPGAWKWKMPNSVLRKEKFGILLYKLL